MRALLSGPALALHDPIETISNSEGGFERIHQGTCTLLAWPLRLEPGERKAFRIEQHVMTVRDEGVPA